MRLLLPHQRWSIDRFVENAASRWIARDGEIEEPTRPDGMHLSDKHSILLNAMLRPAVTNRLHSYRGVNTSYLSKLTTNALPVSSFKTLRYIDLSWYSGFSHCLFQADWSRVPRRPAGVGYLASDSKSQKVAAGSTVGARQLFHDGIHMQIQ